MIRRDEDINNVWAKLAAPLDPGSIKVLAQPGRPPMNYVDSRTVTDRLDAVVPGEWDVTLELLPMRVNPRDGEEYALKARLQVLGVIREDVGQGADYKSAASDALKRAAVRFGIGRELYGEKVEGQPAHAAGTASVAGGAPAHTRTAPAPSPTPAAPAVATPSDVPSCPKCGGKMFDNRLSKRNPKAPDFRCRDKEKCDGVIWPERSKSATSAAKPGRESADGPFHADEAAPGGEWEQIAPDIPF